MDDQRSAAQRTALHILVIDDEDYIGDMPASISEAEGYQFGIATTVVKV